MTGHLWLVFVNHAIKGVNLDWKTSTPKEYAQWMHDKMPAWDSLHDMLTFFEQVQKEAEKVDEKNN